MHASAKRAPPAATALARGLSDSRATPPRPLSPAGLLQPQMHTFSPSQNEKHARKLLTDGDRLLRWALEGRRRPSGRDSSGWVRSHPLHPSRGLGADLDAGAHGYRCSHDSYSRADPGHGVGGRGVLLGHKRVEFGHDPRRLGRALRREKGPLLDFVRVVAGVRVGRGRVRGVGRVGGRWPGADGGLLDQVHPSRRGEGGVVRARARTGQRR